MEILVWFCLLDENKNETESFPAGTPRTVEAGEILGNGVLQPPSSGRTTAQGGTKERQENSRKCTENARESRENKGTASEPRH